LSPNCVARIAHHGDGDGDSDGRGDELLNVRAPIWEKYDIVDSPP